MNETNRFPEETAARLQLFESCLSRLNDIVIVTEAEPIDEPGPRILYVNEAFVRRTGYTRDEALGRSPRFLQGPNTERAVLDRIYEAMQRWESIRVELVNYTKSGEEFWVELDIVPIADATGWYTHWVAVEREITERKQADAAVFASERMAQATLDALPSPVCVIDASGQVTAVNQAWQSFSFSNGGVASLNSEGASYLAVCEKAAREAPDDPGPQALLVNLQAVLAGKADQFQLEYPCHSPTEPRWFEVRMTHFPGDGPRRVAVVHVDITKSKVAELRGSAQARLMSLLANAAPVPEILDALARGVELENPTMRCSVLLLDADGRRLLHGAAPSLPSFYNDAMDGIEIGPAVGSCGTCAYRRERVIVSDIAHDPLWQNYRDVAAQAGLAACWSEPIRDSEGALLGTFAIYHQVPHAPKSADIATIAAAAQFAALAIERRRDEAALHESEARFANAFEFAAVGIGLIGAGNRWVKVNRALCEMLGYREDELLCKTYREITHPDDLARSDDYVERLKRGEIDRFQHEKRYLHKNGRVVWTLVGASMVHAAGGRPNYGVVQVQDITALKTAVSERDLLFELSPDLLCVAFIDGQFKQVNPAWTRVLGWSEPELLATSYLDLVHPDDLAETRAAGARLLRGEPAINFENRYRCKDGTYRLLAWNSFPLAEAGLTFAVVRDVTARAAADQARKELDEQQQEKQKMEALGNLAGGIAHDFNNILAVILGNAALAQRMLATGGAAADKITQIETAGQRAVDLVQQILTFSRRQPRQLRALSLCDLVTETMSLLRATIPAGIEIETRLDAEVPPVLADSTQMHQILMNLCTNAWHALKERPGFRGRIEIGVTSGPATASTTSTNTSGIQSEDMVCLSVRDNGIGMDAATRAQIFDPFFTTREVGLGTGLGLAVVHGIVASHHGSIAVESEPGRGTTVNVYLPASKSAIDEPSVLDEEQLPAISEGRGKHVLYIDDEAQLVMLARELLEIDGYQVTGHVDAKAALEDLQRNPSRFDLVVTDFNMPQYSGLDVARSVAALRPDLPVVVASGYITTALQAEAATWGVRQLLHKPDLATRLRSAVREILSE